MLGQEIEVNIERKGVIMKMNIAMAADVYYKDQLEVAMKSILLYNRNVHFFLLNKDFTERKQFLSRNENAEESYHEN